MRVFIYLLETYFVWWQEHQFAHLQRENDKFRADTENKYSELQADIKKLSNKLQLEFEKLYSELQLQVEKLYWEITKRNEDRDRKA